MPTVKKPRTPQDTLPPRLRSLLEDLTHRELAARLERVYRAAALAIDRLGHLNIVKYEPTTLQEAAGADLSLWETMAPAIRDTVVDVNALVSAIHEAFPPPAEAARSDTWAPPPASVDERLEREVEVVLHTSAGRLSRRVADLGQRVRRPEVVSDHWALMAELQSFRADFRAQMGDLVYLTAAAFTDVRREDVVPGYQTQVGAAAALRGAVADLRRSLQSKLEKAVGVTPSELPGQVRRMEESLAAFAGMPASLTMKTRDKRLLVELRERLRELASSPAPTPGELQARVEPFLGELGRVGAELTQRTLAVHDRAVWAACGARLEQAAMHLFLGSPGAERVVREAVETAEALHGRAPVFDAFLRKVRVATEQSFEDEAQLRETLEVFRERLAALPFT
ncbi:hypothetical protein [Vitiosangium sp. GDMCC 1.1324]|uniref:hypothetical protein n=1 Tax=Vitiosangium sp. (strain GDMCC 1.1324) TaxID=2138576 RepID=UPI000D3D58F7|nr:hypothetical protein [Vitiosangium sp. GDMCC 1.1324]PTL81628.1 hypothetical protein DAT35_22010 [Vitiosangium sp. GDMCC 1.1324]